MSDTQENIENLSKIFQEGLDLFNKIDKTNEATNSTDVQANIKRSMAMFEKATQLTSIAGLFSSNESIEEIATADIQYMLLPALLGTLTLKITSGERKEIVELAEIYFKDYLQRCNDYGLCDYTFKDHEAPAGKSSNQFDQLKDMVMTRQNKIQRFKQQKELQSKLDDLKINMSAKNTDEELKRNYVLTMVKLYILKSIEELDSIEIEKPMLVHMEKQKETGSKPAKDPPRSKPLKPVIITKDAVQKAVFGLGYPSLPTFTVQEFYDQRIKDGIFPDPTVPKKGPMSLQERALAGIEDNNDDEETQNEEMMENDDPELLKRLRDKDDFKDDHRRGWGNRMNRS